MDKYRILVYRNAIGYTDENGKRQNLGRAMTLGQIFAFRINEAMDEIKNNEDTLMLMRRLYSGGKADKVVIEDIVAMTKIKMKELEYEINNL